MAQTTTFTDSGIAVVDNGTAGNGNSFMALLQAAGTVSAPATQATATATASTASAPGGTMGGNATHRSGGDMFLFVLFCLLAIVGLIVVLKMIF